MYGGQTPPKFGLVGHSALKRENAYPDHLSCPYLPRRLRCLNLGALGASNSARFFYRNI